MQDNDHFSDSECDKCNTKNEPQHNEAEHDPIDDLHEVKRADKVANVKQEIRKTKAKVVDSEEIITPLQEDVKAIGKGKMETMASLEESITRTHAALCSTIDMVREVQIQLNGTQDKLAHLEDTMGEIDLAHVTENVSQLLTSTENTNEVITTLNTIVAGLDRKVTDGVSRFDSICGNVDTLNTQMAGFGLAEVLENIDDRFHNVCQKVRRVEKQADEMTGLREKVAEQSAKLSEQDEKINALELKLERFANYFENKMETIEEDVRSIPKIWGRLIEMDDYTNTNSMDIKRLRDDHNEASTRTHRKLDEVDSLCVRLGEDVERCAQNTQATDDAVLQQYEETAKLKDKIVEVRKYQADMLYETGKASTNAANNVADMREKITKLNDKIEEVAGNQEDVASCTELHVMNAVLREVSSLDEKLGQFAEGYDRSVKECDIRFDQIYVRLSGQEGLEDSALKKINKLEKQGEIVPYLQVKLTRLDASTASAIRTLDAECRQDSTRVNAKLTLIQNETKTLFKNVDNLDGAIGVAKKKLVELDQEGPAVIPKAIVQVWKDFQSIKMRRYSDFEEFKSIFVFYAKAAGVPEHAWKAEMHSRMSNRVQNATTWLLERNDSFDEFCRQLSASLQRVRTV